MVVCVGVSVNAWIYIWQYIFNKLLYRLRRSSCVSRNLQILCSYLSLIAGIGLALYGMFTGATYTVPIRNMMLIALAVFWPVERLLVPLLGNDGLWISFLIFVGIQSLILFYSLRKLREKIYKIK